MTARKLTAKARQRRTALFAGLSLALTMTLSGFGCAARRLRKEAESVPVRGTIDVGQARELDNRGGIPRWDPSEIALSGGREANLIGLSLSHAACSAGASRRHSSSARPRTPDAHERHR